MGMVYEALLLFGPLLVIAFLYSVIVDFSDRANPEWVSAKRYGLQFTIGALMLMYFVWSWSKGRCTLPMQTLGLRLETVKGEPLSLQRALARALIAAPLAMCGISLLWALFDRDSQTIHDRLAGTRLVYVPIGKLL